MDPNNESGTLADTGFVESIQTINELIAWSVGPYMMMNGTGVIFGGVMLLLVIISIVIAKACKWWYKIPLGERKALHLGR